MSKRKMRNNVTVNNGENIEVNPETKEEQGTPVQPEENPGEDQNSHENKGHRKPSIKKQAAAVGTTIVKGVATEGRSALWQEPLSYFWQNWQRRTPASMSMWTKLMTITTSLRSRHLSRKQKNDILISV